MNVSLFNPNSASLLGCWCQRNIWLATSARHHQCYYGRNQSFQTCEKAGSISKIYLLKGDEIGNDSSFSGKAFKFPDHAYDKDPSNLNLPIETQLFLSYMFLKNDMIMIGWEVWSSWRLKIYVVPKHFEYIIPQKSEG